MPEYYDNPIAQVLAGADKFFTEYGIKDKQKKERKKREATENVSSFLSTGIAANKSADERDWDSWVTTGYEQMYERREDFTPALSGGEGGVNFDIGYSDKEADRPERGKMTKLGKEFKTATGQEFHDWVEQRAMYRNLPSVIYASDQLREGQEKKEKEKELTQIIAGMLEAKQKHDEAIRVFPTDADIEGHEEHEFQPPHSFKEILEFAMEHGVDNKTAIKVFAQVMKADGIDWADDWFLAESRAQETKRVAKENWPHAELAMNADSINKVRQAGLRNGYDQAAVDKTIKTRVISRLMSQTTTQGRQKIFNLISDMRKTHQYEILGKAESEALQETLAELATKQGEPTWRGWLEMVAPLQPDFYWGKLLTQFDAPVNVKEADGYDATKPIWTEAQRARAQTWLSQTPDEASRTFLNNAISKIVASDKAAATRQQRSLGKITKNFDIISTLKQLANEIKNNPKAPTATQLQLYTTLQDTIRHANTELGADLGEAALRALQTIIEGQQLESPTPADRLRQYNLIREQIANRVAAIGGYSDGGKTLQEGHKRLYDNAFLPEATEADFKVAEDEELPHAWKNFVGVAKSALIPVTYREQNLTRLAKALELTKLTHERLDRKDEWERQWKTQFKLLGLSEDQTGTMERIASTARKNADDDMDILFKAGTPEDPAFSSPQAALDHHAGLFASYLDDGLRRNHAFLTTMGTTEEWLDALLAAQAGKKEEVDLDPGLKADRALNIPEEEIVPPFVTVPMDSLSPEEADSVTSVTTPEIKVEYPARNLPDSEFYDESLPTHEAETVMEPDPSQEEGTFEYGHNSLVDRIDANDTKKILRLKDRQIDLRNYIQHIAVIDEQGAVSALRMDSIIYKMEDIFPDLGNTPEGDFYILLPALTEHGMPAPTEYGDKIVSKQAAAALLFTKKGGGHLGIYPSEGIARAMRDQIMLYSDKLFKNRSTYRGIPPEIRAERAAPSPRLNSSSGAGDGRTPIQQAIADILNEEDKKALNPDG